MKTAKSSKRKAAARPTAAAVQRANLIPEWFDRGWMKDMETQVATMQALLEQMRGGEASPIRTAVGLLHAEAKAAAAKLGFDTSRDDWKKLLSEEAESYPHTQAGGDEEAWRQVPKPGRCRIRALELIEWFRDIARDIEPHIQETENWLAELRSVLEGDPAPMPLSTIIQQIHEYDSKLEF
jgi:hypothetical protein